MLRGMVRMVSEMAFYQVTHRLARLIETELPQDTSPHWTQEQLAAKVGNRARGGGAFTHESWNAAVR